jgi:nucleoside-diphosphate-sugar epimerase
MTVRKPGALVIGGTGPTGPDVVNGLLTRGYQVTILDSGLHEASFGSPVEHVHADAHVLESMRDALRNRIFDLGIAMYGRLRHVATVLADRVGRLMTVGGVFYEGWVNDQFHSAGDGEIAEAPVPSFTFPPVPVTEESPLDSNPGNKFAVLALRSERLVMDLHAAAVLAATDHPDEAGGEVFNVGDGRAATSREWIGLLAAALGQEFSLVSLPFGLAAPAHPYARDPWSTCHHVLDTTKLRTVLGCRPPASVEDRLRETACYLAANPPGPGSQPEQQVGDPFDYTAEDQHLAEAARMSRRIGGLLRPSFRYRHPYRHPAPAGGLR